MPKRSTIVLVVLVLVVGGYVGSTLEEESDPPVVLERPNFVLIVTDDLDFDEIATYSGRAAADLQDLPSFSGAKARGLAHTSAQGYDLGYSARAPMITPNIDSLAEQGVILSRFYVTSPVCTPSRYSTLTGRYASRNGYLREVTPADEPLVIGFNTPLEGEISLPKVLREHGYRTGMAGKWHNFGAPKSARGNAQYQGVRYSDPKSSTAAGLIAIEYEKIRGRLLASSGFEYVSSLYPGNIEEVGLPESLYRGRKHNLEWITEGAVKFIDQHAKEPFFLYVATTVPHGWVGAIGSDDDRLYTPAGILKTPPDSNMPTRADVNRRIEVSGHGVPMSTWLDDSVGAILDRLEVHGIDENTVVIFTSDHGNRGKESLYEAARVPFIVRWPARLPAGSHSDAIVGNIDIAPTILEMAGLENSPHNVFDGVSQLPTLTGSESQVRDWLMLEISASRAVVTPAWKYIANRPPELIMRKMREEADLPTEQRKYGWDAGWNRPWYRRPSGDWLEPAQVAYRTAEYFPGYFDSDQLYDLHRDPYEQRNLISDPSNELVRDKLRSLLTTALKSTSQNFGEFSSLD